MYHNTLVNPLETLFLSHACAPGGYTQERDEGSGRGIRPFPTGPIRSPEGLLQDRRGFASTREVAARAAAHIRRHPTPRGEWRSRRCVYGTSNIWPKSNRIIRLYGRRSAVGCRLEGYAPFLSHGAPAPVKSALSGHSGLELEVLTKGILRVPLIRGDEPRFAVDLHAAKLLVVEGEEAEPLVGEGAEPRRVTLKVIPPH